jgi:GT2 family glycosyltransferase
MKNKNTISVILPVYNLDENTKKLFANAVKSIKGQSLLPNELIIVVAANTEDSEYVKTFDFLELNEITTIICNDGPTDFASQVNLGVKNAKSEWISILEQDDEYASIWFKNVVEYQEAYPDTGIFMPIIVDTDINNSFLAFTNEVVWANSFSDVLGVLDFNALLSYQNFNTDGVVIKKDLFEDNGGFKSNIKLTFIYEFLLRMAFKDTQIMVIPKFGYKHLNQREGSLFNTYSKTIDPVEAKWWLSQAKREYYYSHDRQITYDAQLS